MGNGTTGADAKCPTGLSQETTCTCPEPENGVQGDCSNGKKACPTLTTTCKCTAASGSVATKDFVAKSCTNGTTGADAKCPTGLSQETTCTCPDKVNGVQTLDCSNGTKACPTLTTAFTCPAKVNGVQTLDCSNGTKSC